MFFFATCLRVSLHNPFIQLRIELSQEPLTLGSVSRRYSLSVFVLSQSFLTLFDVIPRSTRMASSQVKTIVGYPPKSCSCH